MVQRHQYEQQAFILTTRKEKNNCPYTLSGPFWRFALVPFRLILWSARKFLITTHLTLSRKCLRHLLQMRATSATALETLSVCYQPFQHSFNIILVWFKYNTLLPELMMSSLYTILFTLKPPCLSPRWPVVSPTSSFVSFANRCPVHFANVLSPFANVLGQVL